MAIGRNPQSAARKWFAAAINCTLSIVSTSSTFAFSPWQEEAKPEAIAEHEQVDPPSSEDKQPTSTEETRITVTASAESPENIEVKVNATEDSEKVSKYWIGIALKKVEGDLATHLGSDDGMLIFQVYPDSPAAKAGWKEGDIVLSFNGRVIDDFQPLMEEIGKVENKPTKVVMIRQGAKLEQEITPEPRPEEVAGTSNIQMQLNLESIEGLPNEMKAIIGSADGTMGDIKVLQGAFKALKGGQKLELTNIGTPQDAIFMTEKIELPKELTITIKKSDDKPATISVTVDGEEATTTEDKVESLPEKAKPFVLRLLARGEDAQGAISMNGGAFKVFSGKSPQVVIGQAEITAEVGDEKSGEGKQEKRRIVVQSKEGDGELRVYSFDSDGAIPEGKLQELAERARAEAEAARVKARGQAGQAEDKAREKAEEAAEKAREALSKILRDQNKDGRSLVDGTDLGSLKKEIAELKKQVEELKAEAAKK